MLFPGNWAAPNGLKKVHIGPQVSRVSRSVSTRLDRKIGMKTKALMVIGSLCPISVEGVLKGLRWGIGPEGGEALSSHHIWTFIPPARP
jgi:hypothetical protein